MYTTTTRGMQAALYTHLFTVSNQIGFLVSEALKQQQTGRPGSLKSRKTYKQKNQNPFGGFSVISPLPPYPALGELNKETMYFGDGDGGVMYRWECVIMAVL